ncbi:MULTISPECIES: hypothetical protein [unclassified Bradyrhizobium]|uniref:hypothetical protein n=1 Tax=unclassified Bradyrhizobium TaxID=2631580 RepID=UPI0028E6B6BE|nr:MULTISPECIES: hypothetical protein [unclassified Bradyrhizobium]
MRASDYSAYLTGIEMGARIMIRNAKLMPSRPDFETKAEAELARARQVLTDALESVVRAQAEYQRKPVDA